MRAYQLIEDILDRQSKDGGISAFLTRKQAGFLRDLCQKEWNCEEPPHPILGRVGGSSPHKALIQCSFGVVSFHITNAGSGFVRRMEDHLPTEEHPLGWREPRE